MSSVTLVHPAKAVGWNEMLFGRDIRVVPSNIVLDTGTGPPNENGGFGVHSPKFAAMPPIAKLLWLLLIKTT